MESHLGHSTSTEHEETRRIFFDDPLFEEFALRPLILDGCPLGEVSATASSIEEGDSDGWFREWSAAGDRLAGYGDASAHADHDSTDLTDAEGGASSHTSPLLKQKQARKTLRPTPPARSSTRSSSTSSKAAAPGGYYRGISPRVGNRLAWWFGRWRVDGTFERLNQRRFVRATEGEVGKEPATSCLLLKALPSTARRSPTPG
jgi:hypothetical protein